mgnify:FL=1
MHIEYITGYAGTGKSTALLKQLTTIAGKDKDDTIVLCPTHKAAHRLLPKIPFGIEIKTIHSLLGWIPAINENAEKIEHIDIVAKTDRKIEEYNTFIIDEGGMMSEEMFMELVAKIEDARNFDTDGIKIYVYLDPYQLLPVKGRQIQLDEEFTTKLTTQHRAESPDVVALFTKFVEFLEGTNTKDLKIDFSENVKKVSTTEAVQLFDITKDRLLAYTNEVVGWYNKEISIYNGIQSFVGQQVQLGSNPDLVYVEDMIDKSSVVLSDVITWYLDGELLLQNSKISAKYMELEFSTLLKLDGVEFAKVAINGTTKIVPVVLGIYNAYSLTKQIKAAAIKDKKNYKFIYALNKAYTMDYKFASTVHKAQGSEFDAVFVDVNDIKKSILPNYYDTYARLMYVALSRAKKRVYIIQD